ncbi:uncharacterized protein [Amphiura filiformis]|uniref:uncharacterized protein n=1 Tax=Amphiura filiformis TaxID=82378 RepID=UPI003B20BBF6
MEEFEHLVHLDVTEDGQEGSESTVVSVKPSKSISAVDVKQIPLPPVEVPVTRKAAKQSNALDDSSSDMDIETSSPTLPPVKSVGMDKSSGTKDVSVVSSGEGKAGAQAPVLNSKESSSTQKHAFGNSPTNETDILSVMDSKDKGEEKDTVPESRVGREFSERQKFTPRTVRMSNSSKGKPSKKAAADSLKDPTSEAPKKPPVVEWRIGFVRREGKSKEDSTGESSQDEEGEKIAKESKSTNKEELAKKFNILPNLPKKDPMLGLTSEVKERLARAIAGVGKGDNKWSPPKKESGPGCSPNVESSLGPKSEVISVNDELNYLLVIYLTVNQKELEALMMQQNQWTHHQVV